jgi:hypothetical protein
MGVIAHTLIGERMGQQEVHIGKLIHLNIKKTDENVKYLLQKCGY